MPDAAVPSNSVVSRILCFLGWHPYSALRDDATCGVCGRFVR